VFVRIAVLIIGSCLPASACGGAPSQTTSQASAATVAPASNARPATRSAPPSNLFGGQRWGFVEASTRNGRLVVLRRFSGHEPPRFGHHGETGEQPELTVFDRVSGEERAIDEIIAIDPSRRWLLVLDTDQLWLAEATSGVWQPLDDVDMDADDNACLPPRQASFSAGGKRVAWVSAGAASLNVRDLDSGRQWSVPAKGTLWRGWPEDEGRAVVMAEIPAGAREWPRQRTSCACRWCNRFALSAGFYGWAGPSFTVERVDEDGSRDRSEPHETRSPWHGDTESGCTLMASSQRAGLDRGPWRWACP
jgi:hypothetical protein